jgi:hypothetical protein
MHYYTFYWNKDWEFPVYDRTFPDLRSTSQWLKKQLEERKAFFTVDCLPKRYFY